MLTEKHKREIMREAERWWDARGRHLVPKHLNQNTPAPDVRSGNGPIFISKSATVDDLSTGILSGNVWNYLDAHEQAQIMFCYFQQTWLPAHPEIQHDARLH